MRASSSASATRVTVRRRTPRVARANRASAPTDVLVFEHSANGFALIGGTGRGASWAGIVDLAGEESLVARAWDSGLAARQTADRPRQIAGPYHARYAIAAPVGDRHVVLFGANQPLDLRDSEVARIAAEAVDQANGIPASKLLADELELVHTLRALMAYRPENVEDTLGHVAQVAAAALSCDVAIVRVVRDGRTMNGSGGPNAPQEFVSSTLSDRLAAATATGNVELDQAGSPGRGEFGIEIASHMILPIGNAPALGAIALAHSADRPRGFTSLCQRIGRAVADAAELLITQAAAREQLAAERDLLARMSGTDALTGTANRRAWMDEADRIAACEPIVGQVLSCDLDGLKAANDRYGHSAGDELIRATSNLLNSSVRDVDLVARVGGDEFAVLLRHADDAVARRVEARIRRAERVWRITEHGLTPRLSIGRAPLLGNDLEAARQVADKRMYANKRRRARRAQSIGRPPATRDRRAKRGV
jgi:diguanylate cyclase (GGDEF)-like protein